MPENQGYEANLEYAYNSLLQSHMDLIKTNSYKDAIIAELQEQLDIVDTEDAEDAE